MTRGVPGVDRDAVERYLRALFGSARSGALVEVRFRIGAGMGRSFHAVDKFDELRAVIAGHAHRRDVFVGVLPRARRGGGGQDLVEDAAVVWADCDGPGAAAALRRFAPRPSMVVTSGSATNCHAYWLLSRPVAVEVIERTNRRVALALAADVRSSDGPRILRPGGCTNWKSWPPSRCGWSRSRTPNACTSAISTGACPSSRRRRALSAKAVWMALAERATIRSCEFHRAGMCSG